MNTFQKPHRTETTAVMLMNSVEIFVSAYSSGNIMAFSAHRAAATAVSLTGRGTLILTSSTGHNRSAIMSGMNARRIILLETTII